MFTFQWWLGLKAHNWRTRLNMGWASVSHRNLVTWRAGYHSGCRAWWDAGQRAENVVKTLGISPLPARRFMPHWSLQMLVLQTPWWIVCIFTFCSSKTLTGKHVCRLFLFLNHLLVLCTHFLLFYLYIFSLLGHLMYCDEYSFSDLLPIIFQVFFGCIFFLYL